MSIETPKPYRIAIYAAPDPNSEWWKRGSQWLGRCAQHQREMPQPEIAGITPQLLKALTADPRRYGWHATLKAPMRLSSKASLQILRDHIATICREHAAFDLPELTPVRLGGFLALKLASPAPALHHLADDCVRRLQPIAEPLNAQELERRRRQTLTPEEDALLVAWGYPWVFHKFQFHFSLTGSLHGLPDDAREHLLRAARQHFADLEPMRMDRLSLFIEPAPGADFELLEQFALS
jgi:Protein of unknown function (DUF1045)